MHVLSAFCIYTSHRRQRSEKGKREVEPFVQKLQRLSRLGRGIHLIAKREAGDPPPERAAARKGRAHRAKPPVPAVALHRPVSERGGERTVLGHRVTAEPCTASSEQRWPLPGTGMRLLGSQMRSDPPCPRGTGCHQPFPQRERDVRRCGRGRLYITNRGDPPTKAGAMTPYVYAGLSVTPAGHRWGVFLLGEDRIDHVTHERLSPSASGRTRARCRPRCAP